MANASTIITASTIVRGRLSGEEDLDVFGQIEGQIDLQASLKIDTKGRVEAEVNANNVYIHGVLLGNATASETIHLTDSATVVGDLTAPRIIIDDGARIRGLVDMGSAGQASAKPAPSRRTKPATQAPKAAAEPEADDEPELPSGAAKKKVAVKSRG